MKNMFATVFLLLGVWCHSNLQAQKVEAVTYYPMLNWDTSPYKSFRYTRAAASWEWINFRLLYPNGYDSTAMDGKEYPLIILLHGGGESGRMEWNNSTKTNSPYAVDDPRRDNNDHHLLFGGREHLRAVQSGRFPGFVLFPQNSYGTWVKGKGDASSTFHQDLEKAVELVEYLVNHLKIDPARIYIEGLSAGGLGTWMAAYKRPDLFAAALPMSAPGDPAMAQQLKKLPLWVFQGELDTNPRAWATRQTVDAVVAAGGEVRYTEYKDVEHNTWNRAYGEPDFYDWMLGKRKVDTTSPNQSPLVNAGADKSITLPANSTAFTASASDPDGTIISYSWKKVSGPETSLSGANTATLSVSDLVEGSYVFQVDVKDNKDAMASDEVVLMVNPAANQIPTVNAGPDKTITLPVNSISFSATASDPDGNIASYSWEKTAGPEIAIGKTDAATLSLQNLPEGVYTFKVTVADNKGAKAWDEVQLTVNPRPNQAPVVNAGADKTISLPANTASFTATASDPDGNIATYLWEKVSGPAVNMSGVTVPTLSLAGLVEGTYTFKITVADNAGARASDQVVLVVQPAPNQSPTVNAGVDREQTMPANTVTIPATASDPDGNIASYTWEKVSGPAATLSGTATATLTLSGLVEGTYVFRLTVKDNKGAAASDDVTLVVKPRPNQVPQVNAGADKSLTLPTNSTTLAATASDPDGNIDSYTWEKLSGPAARMGGANTSSLSLSGLVEGTYRFKVTVRDNEGATATDEVVLVVNPAANQLPTVTAGADKTITLPTNSATFTATASDPDGSIVSYLWEKVSGPDGNIGNANSATLSLQNLAEGMYIFKVTVTDNKGAKAWDEVHLQVKPRPNQAPVVDAGADKTISLPENRVTFSATASDPDGNIASYQWEKVNGPAASISGAATSTLTVNNVVEGKYIFKVTVTDNKGATASDEVQLTVNPRVNQAPTVNAGTDKTITLPAGTTTFSATVSDPDGNITSYQWEKVSGPMAKLSGTSTPTLSVTEVMEGIYRFRVTVTDNSGAIATDDVQLTVNPRPNQAPAVNAGTDRTITLPTKTVSLTANGTDPDGTITSWLWEKVSGPAVTLVDANTATLTINGLVVGNYVFRITVTDNRGARATDEVSLLVKEAANKAPVVNAGEDLSITLPENTATFQAKASDPDGTIASYRWEKVNGPSVSVSGANSATLLLADLVQGAYTFRITVTDNKGGSASDDVNLTVFGASAGNQVPVANAGPDTTVYLPLDYLVLKGTALDNDGTITSYLWEQISGPGVRMGYVDSTNMELARLEEGVYIFRFTATDNEGVSGSDEMTLVVGPMVSGIKPAEATSVSAIAYPNPFEQDIHLRVKTTQQEMISITLYDVLARKLKQESFETRKDEPVEYTIRLPAGRDQSGVYFIQLQNQNGSYRQLIKVVRK